MLSVAGIILYTAVAQIHAAEVAVDKVLDPTDEMIDKVASSLVDTLFDRAHGDLKASFPDQAGLDDTTLAKTQLAKSGNALHTRPVLPVSNSPFCVPVPVPVYQPQSHMMVPPVHAASFSLPGRERIPQVRPQTNPKINNAAYRRQNKLAGSTPRRPVPEVPAGTVFEKKLKMVGTGYRCALKGKTVVVSAGYSHDVEVPFWKETTVTLDKPGTEITVTGKDKQQVGMMAQKLRNVRKPNVYSGAGVRYEDEVVKLKAGKQGKAR